MSKGNSKKQKRTAATRQTGVNTAALPTVASMPVVDGQDALAPLADQPLEANTTAEANNVAAVAVSPPERNDTASLDVVTPARKDTAVIEAAPVERSDTPASVTPFIEAAPLARNDTAIIQATDIAPAELPNDFDRFATAALETPTSPVVDGNGNSEATPIGGQLTAPSANGNGHFGATLPGGLLVTPSANGNGHSDVSSRAGQFYSQSVNGNGHRPNGNGHSADLAMPAIYQVTSDNEQLNLQQSTLNPQQSAISASVRPRRYALSHTGVKHGARLVSHSLRLEALQERRLVAAAAGAMLPISHHASRTLPGRRLAASTRRYPIFLMRQRGAEPKKGGAGLRIFILLALLFFISFGSIVGGLVGGFFVYARDLPSVSNLSSSGDNFETTRIYDRNGILLAEIFDQGRRTYVPLSKISKYLIDAAVATEDASFYSNVGVDPVALVRAVFINFSGRGTSGASTITQQLARIMLLSDQRFNRSFDRKIREGILAVEITQAYSKDQILELYLNQIYYGNLAYGIEAASESYFGKHASELALPEAAMLAGLPQSPTDYDPTQNFDAAKQRQMIVLGLMLKSGKISPEQEQAAASATIILHPAKSDIKAPHFVQYVKEYLDAQYGPDVVSRGGLVVTTTLDLRVQAEAERSAIARVSALKELSATNAAMVVMKPDTGEILAMVGSVDYNNAAIDGQVNVATRERQPGSSLKPIVYAAAFQKGWNPTTSILDVDTLFGYRAAKPYEPHNYDHNDHGWVTVRTALANSFNIPAVKALQFAGIQNVLDLAHSMGIKNGLYRSPNWYGLSLALGGGEVTLLEETNAYATFANGGREVDATPILKMTDSRGNVVQAVNPNAPGTQVLDPGIAYQIGSILSDNQARSREFGLDSPLKVSFPAAAKTGTTDDNRDSWTMGYTPNLVVGVWVGNNDNSRMLSVTGALGAAYIWHDFMESFYANPDFKRIIAYNLPDQTLASGFSKPNDVVKDTVCTMAKGDVTDYFIAGKEPTNCRGYKDPPENKVRGYAGDTPIYKPTPTPSTNGNGTGYGNGNGNGNPTNNGGGITAQPSGGANNGGGDTSPSSGNNGSGAAPTPAAAPDSGQGAPPSNPPAATPVTNPGKPANNGENSTGGGGG